jgi:hypothetical protein
MNIDTKLDEIDRLSLEHYRELLQELVDEAREEAYQEGYKKGYIDANIELFNKEK